MLGMLDPVPTEHVGVQINISKATDPSVTQDVVVTKVAGGVTIEL
jgi:hypothetical protein